MEMQYLFVLIVSPNDCLRQTSALWVWGSYFRNTPRRLPQCEKR